MKSFKGLIVAAMIMGAFTLNSCKKDKKATASASGTVTASIDGTAISFSNRAVVLTGSTNGNNFTAIQGNASDGSSMSITVYGTLTAGETITSNDPDPGNEPELLYVSGSNNYMNGTDNPSVTVKITAVSAANIQGTFSGTVTEFTSGAPKVITDGKFNVQVQ